MLPQTATHATLYKKKTLVTEIVTDNNPSYYRSPLLPLAVINFIW